MPVNQPPIKESPVESSWDYEVTQLINTLERRIVALEERVRQLEES